jgi:hypothetical protein
MKVILAVIFCIAIGFGDDKKQSNLPPFTKREAHQYLKDFNYWNEPFKH